MGGRFTTDSGESEPINSAWHLFETLYQSGLYWKFLGWSQLIAGALLLTQRFATLGAVMFLPVSLNIFFITLSYYFAYTPVLTGLMLLANIGLLLWDYQKFLPIIRATNLSVERGDWTTIENHKVWQYTGVLLFLFTIGYVVVLGRSPVLWVAGCGILGILGLIVFGILNQRKS